jgi:hypothetical protein
MQQQEAHQQAALLLAALQLAALKGSDRYPQVPNSWPLS